MVDVCAANTAEEAGVWVGVYLLHFVQDTRVVVSCIN
jgi:hypothetical protein